MPIGETIPLNLTRTGRHAPSPSEEMKSHGRHYGRTVDMFGIPAITLNAGITYHGTDSQPSDPSERRALTAFGELLKIIPNLIELLMDPNPAPEHTLTRISGALLSGSNAARSDDTRSVKVSMIEWLASDLAAENVVLHPTNKVLRGFSNAVTGRLLCPAVLDWASENVRASLRDHTATIDGRPVNGSDWPMFVFDQVTYNPDRQWESFLHGDLLVTAYRHVFISPSSALLDDQEANGGRGTRHGNAALHGMTKVTPGSIIYVATHVHFALSPVAVFNKNHKKSDTIAFHYALLEFFEDPVFAATVEDLLTWWNAKIFPTSQAAVSATNYGLQAMRDALLQHNGALQA